MSSALSVVEPHKTTFSNRYYTQEDIILLYSGYHCILGHREHRCTSDSDGVHVGLGQGRA